MDVAEVVTGGLAVDALELLGCLQRRARALGDRPRARGVDYARRKALELIFVQVMKTGIQRRVPGRLRAQRIELSRPVPEVPDRPDVLGGPDDLVDIYPGGSLPVGPDLGWAPVLEEAPRAFVDG